jgi:hypothetical protein
VEEGSSHIIPIKKFNVVIDHFCDIKGEFVEAKSFDAAPPDEAADEVVDFFRCIPKFGQIFTQNYDDFGTDALGIFDELQFVQATPSSLIVAGNNNLFLLHCQGLGLQGRLFDLEY